MKTETPTKQAWTSGPWHISKSSRYVRYHRGESFDYNICDCDMGCPPDEIAANAKLIAKAPEMAEALRCAETILILLKDEVSRLGCNADKVLPKIQVVLKEVGAL